MPRHLRGLRRVIRDAYVPVTQGDDFFVELAAIAQLFGDRYAFSHETAAQVFNVPLPPAHDSRVHVSLPGAYQPPRRAGLVGHEACLPTDHVTQRRGIVLTSPGRTFVDLGAILGVPDLVAVGDFFVGRGLCSLADMDDVIAWALGRRGIRRARLARGLINGGARSRPESLIRVWCELSGLPEPEVNGWIFDPDGRARYRGDLVYRAARVVVEYDGAYHRAADQFAADLRRRNDLQRWGWRIVHVEASMLRRPLEVVALIRDALDSAAP